MNYVITGAAGNISHLIVRALLQAGHKVSVIGRDETKLEALVKAGAIALVGSLEDREFLSKSFKGADAVYTMVPPNFSATDWIAFIGGIGENYAYALKENKIQHVVNLSSVGAHLPTGAGPVSGLNHVETTLNSIDGINIVHLRPGYFFQNFSSLVGMVKHMNILGSNIGSDKTMLLADPKDIADAAIASLLDLNFEGVSIKYVVSDERRTPEIATVLGKSVGKPELPWVVFTDEQSLQGALQAGLPEEIARNYTEMGNCLNSGKMTEEFYANPAVFAKVKLEDFAKEFAQAYEAAN